MPTAWALRHKGLLNLLMVIPILKHTILVTIMLEIGHLAVKWARIDVDQLTTIHNKSALALASTKLNPQWTERVV